jgi:hypothetical protein
MAFGVWGPNPISTMLNAVVAWLPKAIVAIIIIVIASAIARVVKDLINGAIGGLSYGPFLAGAAAVIIIALGAIAAVNQVGIAFSVTEPILLTILFTGGAVVAIGVGGGLIKPMQERWERMLSAAERETNTQITAYQQGRTDAMRAPQHARQAQTAQQATYTSGQGAAVSEGPGYPHGTQGSAPGSGYPQGTQGSAPGSGYPQGTQDSGPGYAEGPGSGYPQGSQGPGDPQGTDPGDWHDPGTDNR